MIVDDEETLREALSTYLRLEGYGVDTAESAEDAVRQGIAGHDLLLLDIMMDGMSGVELAEKLKANPQTSGIPIIFITAKDSDEDMVAGLRLGADDYIAKPYSMKNVLARIEAVLRRTARQAPPTANVVCDRNTLTCTVNGKNVKMPRKEFEMLCLLLSNPGKIFSREDFLKRIWPEEIVVVARVVDVNITRLRSKLGRYGKMIVTRSGYGYGWQA